MAIEINNLHHSVRGKTLLSEISATISQARVVGIIGPNGAGKSTLLKCISGLINTQNCISLNGQPLESYGDLQLAQIRAALPQDSSLNFPFKAQDIVTMSFALSALSKDRQERLVRRCLGMMSAAQLANRNFQSLSGGEKQRIHLARVMAQLLQHDAAEQPRYLLLDEPTAPLDMKHQIGLFQQLRQLLTANIATIAVIHDINLAAACCDEIWVMQAGQLIKQGPPNQVISQTMMQDVFGVNVDVNYLHPHALPVISHAADAITSN